MAEDKRELKQHLDNLRRKDSLREAESIIYLSTWKIIPPRTLRALLIKHHNQYSPVLHLFSTGHFCKAL